MEYTLTATQISKKYKTLTALQNTDITIEHGKIYGLIGRNGAGKTTLLSLLTAQTPASSGTVTLNGMPVWEHAAALENICFSREISPMQAMGQNSNKGCLYLRLAKAYYPHWDEAYAQRLIADFEFDTKRPIYKLSKGMMSMLTIIIAMASRAPITILDEPVAGLDIAMRQRFYTILLDDYEKTHRTFIISTHIIEEAHPIFEEVILLHKGSLLEKTNTDDFLSRFCYLEGSAENVDTACEGLKVWNTDTMGRQKIVCVEGQPAQLAAAARQPGISRSRATLQKVFVYLTGGEKEGSLA